jgi:hypothetical protein
MNMRASANIPAPFLLGSFTTATLPAPDASNEHMMAWVSDTHTYMMSTGTKWNPISCKRIETYTGTTDGSGNYSVVYAVPFDTVPHVIPVVGPATAPNVRVKPTVSTVNGFTVNTNTNSGVSILGIDVLLLAASNVPTVAVRVLVVET